MKQHGMLSRVTFDGLRMMKTTINDDYIDVYMAKSYIYVKDVRTNGAMCWARCISDDLSCIDSDLNHSEEYLQRNEETADKCGIFWQKFFLLPIFGSEKNFLCSMTINKHYG